MTGYTLHEIERRFAIHNQHYIKDGCIVNPINDTRIDFRLPHANKWPGDPTLIEEGLRLLNEVFLNMGKALEVIPPSFERALDRLLLTLGYCGKLKYLPDQVDKYADEIYLEYQGCLIVIKES